MVDRELYLPKSWCEEPARCRMAKVPPDAEFATKPRLAERMLSRALDDGLSPAWVLADEVYGGIAGSGASWRGGGSPMWRR